MKVLKEKAWVKEVPCGTCGSTLLVEESDVKAVYTGGSWCENGELHPGFRCPVCKDYTVLEWGDVPNSVIQKLRKE